MLLLARVRQFVRQHALFAGDTRIVAAVSGGSDSVALAHLLQQLTVAGDACLVAVAHFNHQLREDAGRDEARAAEVARAIGVPFVRDAEDVRARARRERRSLEASARAARYAFFERARRECGADVVALGHTQDDQAETVLLRLVRGAGLRGLAGMYPRRGSVVRPLLECRRAELRAFLVDQQLPYVEDSTNSDVGIPRNRVRAELLPLLAGRFNPGIVDALAREAELARETWAWLEQEAARFEQPTASPVPPASPAPPGRPAAPAPRVLELDIERLATAPPPLRRLVLWRAMTSASGGRAVSFRHVDAAVDLLGVDGQAMDAPGQRVQRLGARLVLTGRPEGAVGRLVPAPVRQFEYPLSVPGEVELAEAGCTVSVEAAPAGPARSLDEQLGLGPSAVVRGDRCVGTLTVRNRRPGDRFRPIGLGGGKKLQDHFVDRKTARAERDRVPIVVDGTGRIVWVAGHGIDETFRVTDASQSVLLLRLKLLGGRA